MRELHSAPIFFRDEEWWCQARVQVVLFSDFTLVYFENSAARLLGNEAGRIEFNSNTIVRMLPMEARFEVCDGTKSKVDLMLAVLAPFFMIRALLIN